jgi:multidrug transporter EmrE-like cation transporter
MERKKMDFRESLILIAHSIVIYFVCFAVMGAAMATLPIDTALLVHAAAAPFVSAIFSYIYYKKFNYTSPLLTATVMMVTVILLDFFLTATIILGDYSMFYSLIGTWIPFALIFCAAFLVGYYLDKEQ